MPATPAPTKTYHKTLYPSIDPGRPELSAKGKVVVITGGGTGIGAETALYFAKAGAARIAILGRREQPLLDTKARIEAEHPHADILALATDVTQKDLVETAFSKIAENGKIDVLISNAALLGTIGDISTLTSEIFLSSVVANLQGNFNLATAFLSYAAEDAVIIETSSAAAHLTVANGFVSYNVSKAASSRFYSSLAFENPKISIYNVQPGVVATDMSRASGYKPKEKGAEFAWSEGESVDAMAEFDDVSLPAGFMVWLASPESRFLKGKFLWANWDVDELKTKQKEIEGTPLLNIGLIGWPFT